MVVSNILKLILLSLVLINSISCVTYHGYTQSTFNSIMSQIKNDPNRSTMTNIFIDSYDGGWHDIKDISAISAISECTSLTKFGIQMGLQGYTQEGFEQTMAALLPLKKITDLYIFFYHGNGAVRLTNIISMKPVLMQLPNLTRLYLHFGHNQIVDACETLSEPLPLMKNLTSELYLVFYYNKNTECSCFDGMFDDMTLLKKLHINFQSNQLTTMVPFTNAFKHVTSVTDLTLNLMHNDIAEFTLQRSFETLTKLQYLYLYAGRHKNQGVSNFKDFTVYNSNIHYYRVFMKEGVYDQESCKDMFANMPNLQTVYIYFRDSGYNYKDLKAVVDAIAKAPKFKNLQMEFVYTPLSDPFDYSEWGDLLDNIRDKLRYIYIYDHASYANIYDMRQFTHILRDTPNLYKIYFRTYTNRNTKIPAKIEHPFVTEVTYVNYNNSKARETIDQYGEVFEGFPNLKYPYIEFSYCSLTDDDLNNFHYVYKSLSGRFLATQMYINLRNNKITDTKFLFNPYEKIHPNSYLYLNLQYNQITNFSNFQYNLESLMDPKWNRLYMYTDYNKITDVTGLQNAFQNFKMDRILIHMTNNQVEDYIQFKGIVDGQHGVLDLFRIYMYNNPCQQKQTNLNEVLLPVTREGGKAWVNTYYFSFIDPSYGTNYGKGSLRSAGQYPAIADKGVCWSNWGQSYFYFETLDEDEKVVKNCGKCHNTRCHSCEEDTKELEDGTLEGLKTSSKCTMCRKTNPQRIGDNCICPEGYYDGDSNHECLKCHRLCIACDNGTTCLSEEKCVESIPKRLTNKCICPNKYFDDGVQNQCQNCIIGCNKCDNKNTCQECIDGYFKNSSGICIKCPNKFATCSSATVGITCQGVNRTSEAPDCLCKSKYYDDNQNADCKQCVSPCDTCSSSNFCLSCNTGFYWLGSSCPKCPNKFQACQSDKIGKVCQGQNRTKVTPDCYCESGYYDDGTNADCVICKNNCKNCLSDTHCLSCIDGYYLKDNKCLKCQEKFETCSDFVTGTKCQGTNRTFELPNCECSQGYVDLDGTNQQDCVACTSPCKSCINSKTKCTECIDGYYLNGNTCVKCPNKYAKCSNPTNGIQCQGTSRSSITPSCPCNDKFYDDGTNANCVACTNNCETCQSQSICLTCLKGYYKDGNQCLQCLNKFESCSDSITGTKCQGNNRSQNLPNCECEEGFVDIQGSDQANCSQCTSNCKSCIDQVDKCQSCIDGYYYISSNNSCLKCVNKFKTCSDSVTGTTCQGLNRSSNTPNCECLSGFVDIDNTDQANCVACQSPCKTCQNSTTKCYSCIDGYYLDGNNCVKCLNKFSKCSDAVTGIECQGANRSANTPNCECNLGYYDDQTNKSDCQQCVYPCVNCTSSNTCTSCYDQINRNNDSQCSCEIGYYDNVGEKGCRKCLYKCKECFNTLDNCDSCPDNSFRDNSNNNCQCIDGYFNEIDQPICQKCIDPCQNCTSLTICTKCLYQGANRNDQNGTPSCGCMDGYYENQSHECVKCPNKCNKCIDSETCIDCNMTSNTNRNYDIDTNCGCNEGYYDDQENPNTLECVQCQYPCTQCTSKDICIVGFCATIENRNMESRLCNCNEGYYDSGNECEKCSLKCISCSGSPDFCTGLKCAGNDTREKYPQCTCKEGLKEIGGIDCGVCQNKCEECTFGDPSNCISCVQGFKRHQLNKNCECQNGYYDDGQNSDCQPCLSTCKTCSDGNTCDTCNSQNLDPKKNCVEIIDQTFASFSVVNPTTNMEEQGTCSIACEACENEPSNCIQCKIGLNRSNELPSCQCYEGYHDSNGQLNDCQYKCDLRCKSCVDFNQCSECNEKDNWVMNQQKLMCECKKGFQQIISSNQQPVCQQCNYIYRDLCLQKCPNNTYQDEEQKLCLDLEYKKESSMIPTLIIGSAILVLQIVLFLVLKQVFNRFLRKDLPQHIKQEKQNQLQDEQLFRQQEESDRKLFKQSKDVESVSKSDDDISQTISSKSINNPTQFKIDNIEDFQTVQKNIQQRQSLRQKRLSHAINFRQKSKIIKSRETNNESPTFEVQNNNRNSHFIN